MTTTPQTGLTPARKVGSAVDNKALTSYDTLASAYGTGIGRGDPVKLSSGALVVATNGADAIGVFEGVKYKKTSTGADHGVVFAHNWPTGQVATEIEALVYDDPNATFLVKGDTATYTTLPGDIFALDNIGEPNTYTGRSTVVALVATEVNGDVDIDAMSDLVDGAGVSGLTGGDTFTIRTTNPANSNTTVTITDPMTPAALLAAINAAPGVLATLDATTGFLKIRVTDGYALTMANGSGTPITDLFAVASYTAQRNTVAANAGLVKVIKVIDEDAGALECVLVNHSLRDDG